MATEKRLIDANALIDEIDGVYKRHYANSSYQFIHDFFRAVFRKIHKTPTVDAVEVIRCKDCKYGKLDTSDDYGWYLCQYDGSSWNKEGHFCSYGERKGDGST